MLMPDVNVLVGAHRSDAPRHRELRGWLEGAMSGHETVGLSDAVLYGYIRIVTHPKVFLRPTPPNIALKQMRDLLDAHRSLRIVPGERFWPIFNELCLASDARGNLVSDAAHAATAIEAGAVWITLDRDFARFDGLNWRTPV